MGNTVSPENPWSYSLNLPHDPRSARIARVTLRGVMNCHDLPELLDVTEVLVSELVTNSYLYSDGPCEIRVRQVDADTVRLSIWDTNPDIPAPFDTFPRGKWSKLVPSPPPPEPDPLATCGRGLLIVRLCAENWGSWSIGESFPGVTGKLLWCEIGRKTCPYGAAA
ncbi:ATP-binding protein [Streptomyces sp. NPDC049577]|uniref:ATP-binding protein n=1 Tax=Streptomyces sp. NPDC049577 TaxID=3155153 RepID=UPI0034281E0A